MGRASPPWTRTQSRCPGATSSRFGLPRSPPRSYYVSIDPSGKLGWNSPDLTYQTTTAHVLEVLTGKASNAYKAFLRDRGISNVIAPVADGSSETAALFETAGRGLRGRQVRP